MPQWTVSLPERLDTFLTSEGRCESRAKAQRAIDEGKVIVNDIVKTKASCRLQEGDVVILTEDLSLRESDITPVDLKLPILYEDAACIVIDKPAGIAVHPGAGMGFTEKTILHGAAFLFEERSLPFSSEGVLVHRLDKDTTGCLLLAKDSKVHRALQDQFQVRSIQKGYLAIVAGIPSPAVAVIDAPIGRNVSQRTKMSVLRATGTREAQTTYNTLGKGDRTALLLCDLHTGRTHQIRVHLHAIGHPILGDGTYRTESSERLTLEYDLRQLCLHAWKLRFRSPADDKDHGIIAPLPSHFRGALERLGITWEE